MKARKRFGQHFLKDTHSLQSFRELIAPKSEDHLVEIGPGQGALTDYLIGTTQQLDLIEIDRDLVPQLQHKYGNAITVHEADVLNFDFRSLVKQKKKLRVVGNLPYNISTPLLFHLFEQIDVIQDMHFLLQKEIVDRLSAKPGTQNYSRLSVMTQFYCNAIALMNIPPESFDPPPKVMSTFVRIIPHEAPLEVDDLIQLQNIVRDAFNQRRKTLSNSLKHWISAQELELLNINPKKRPQELSINDFIRISNKVE